MSVKVPLPMAPAEHVPCTRCAKCCTYVGVGINAPNSLRYATDVLWYLYHENVSVHLDGDGEWTVIFEARCRNLRDDLLCGVYEQRPHVCRAFDDTSCEVNAPDGGKSFTEPREFLDWLAARKPGLFRRLSEKYVPPGLGAARPR
jgi:Fe-S-cluster containining protein